MQTTMNPLIKIAYFGFFVGIIISFFAALFFDFFDFFPENYVMKTHRDDYLLLFLWPSCIFLLGVSAIGVDALIPIGVILLINAIRYSVIFLVIGILFKFSPTLSKFEFLHFLKLKTNPIKTLLEFSMRLFFIGSASGFVILIASYIQASLYEKISIWVNIVTFSILPLLETEVFWSGPDVFLKMFEFIFINGVAYSLAALFVGILCNIFVWGRAKLA